MVEAYPLSPLQQGMLFHTVSEPASGVYIEQLCCQLRGALDISAFEAAWREMIKQHDVLRTAFAWQGLPEPLQVVLERAKLPLVVLDWRELPGGLQQQRLSELRAAERLDGFDLARSPLMRIKLIRMSENLHQLVWTWHHIILDAWSVPMIVERFLKTYDAHREGRALDLEPARPFKDFIAWQRSQDLIHAEAFWRKILDGFQEPTPLGVDGLHGISSAETERAARESAANGSPGYGLEFMEVPPGEVDALRDAARRAKVTLNTFMQGAWALLLSRYSGREDVLFGTAVAGRPAELAGVESIAGLMINTLPVRVKTPPDEPLGRWLENLQKQQAEMRRYEYTPLTQLQNWSSVPPGAQLFDSLLVFENFPLDIRRIRSKELEIARFDFVERASLPLTIMMAVREQTRIGAGYDQSRFDAATVRRMLCHLRRLLADMSADPERRLGDLDLLTGSERRQMLEDFSRGDTIVGDFKPGAGPSITRLLEAQVESSPDALAATFAGPHGEVSLTYRELNARANNFARHLRALGIGPEQRVAICMESSLSRLVAVMAVMKAGGVYVPLDPTLPESLQRGIVDDCGARILLTQPGMMADSSEFGAARVIALGEEWERSVLSREGRENLTGGADADGLAYLIYTSGSTGRPKGVAVTHASLRHLVDAQVKAFRIGPDSKVLQFSSLSFDASVSEIFTALLSGAQLYLGPRKLLTPSRDMLRLIERWGINVVTFPPSVLSRLPHSDLPSLKTLVSAGEACTPELVARWATGRLFLNAYGPTECTVCATVAEITDGRKKPTIGRAIGEAQVYILGSNMQPVPVGVAGELYVGGPGVARGYLGRPDLTASSFRPDTFSGVPGSRLYRTGDAARFLPAGEIEFLGRLDDQVKVRGFRIEPAEVEAAIRKEPDLRDAAVIAAGNSADERRLIAFVVPEDRDRAAAGPEWWPSISEYFVYDELAYYAMSSDERRNEAYRAAFREKVRDKVVVEVGTGPEALLARFCVEAGARKVYAIELLRDTYDKARRRVLDLGLGDRIEVIYGDATSTALPEPADVCVSEIVGAIGGSEGGAAILNQAWRLLGEKGEMIPSRSTTMYAPVELPRELLDKMGFGPLPARYVNKIFNDTGHPFDLRLCVKGLSYSHLLARPQVFEDLDFRSIVDLQYSRRATHQIEREGKLDGFLVWLTLNTGAGECLDILKHEHCWLPVFIPVLEGRLAVSAGDRIETRCGGVLCEDARHLNYFVEGTLLRRDERPAPFRHDSLHQGGAFRASPFYKKFFQQDTVPVLAQEPRQSPALDTVALKRRLRERLPEYMIPSEMVQIDSLPLMASGKLDRRALLAIAGERGSESRKELAPPRSQVEILIAGIWQRLLPLTSVGLQSNFFELGGHSLLLLQVQDLIQAELSVDVPVTDLFKYPTVETLARRLSREQVISRQEEGNRAWSRKRALVRREALAAKAEAKAKIKSIAKQVKGQLKDQLKEPSKAILGPNKPSREADAQE